MRTSREPRMPRNPLTGPADPWDARFGFFWYNDREIFHDTRDDIERTARAFAERGINHVITFSITHFRFTFLRHWEMLTEVLSRIVEACHALEIRVIEHHSAHLTHNPLDDQGMRDVEDWFTSRQSRVDSWPLLRTDMSSDPLINGVPISSMRQIDGRTGRWARSAYPGLYDYQGWTLCFNNPDYRRAYLEYLETLYAVGIDGIMTDDVEWFGAGNACACGTCRRLFREQFGYELPDPGSAWERWHGDHGDLSYIAWLRFRIRSLVSFHQAVTDHYGGLGLRPLRPNYTEAALNRNPTSLTLEELPHLDWVFKENDYSTLIRYSWCNWAVEETHRFAVGRWRGIPSMSMFYPGREDAMRFSWALAMSWGHLYLVTHEGSDLGTTERQLRRFEMRMSHLLRKVKRVASIGFYDSRANRTLYAEAESRSLRGLMAWAQACYRRNLPFDLFQREELDRLPQYEVVVLNEIALLTMEELQCFRDFVNAGGTLVWAGRTGAKDGVGADRAADVLADHWGIEGFRPIPDGGEVVTHEVGAGRLVRLSGDFGLSAIEPIFRPGRGQDRASRVPYVPLSAEQQNVRDGITGFLAGLLPCGPTLEITGLHEDILATSFESEGGQALVIHLVNAIGTLAVQPGAPVGHDDPIPFPRADGPPGRLVIRRPAHLADHPLEGAFYHDPDLPDAHPLEAVESEGKIAVEVEPSRVAWYALIEIVFEGE